MRALAIAATGMNAQQMNLEVIANNIANLNTTGFKGARAEFTDLLYQAERQQGVPNAPLLIFIGCALVGWLDGAGGRIGPYVRVLGAAALAWWAIDEVVRGVNPWRRCLGAGVLAFLVWKVARLAL